MTWRGRQTQGQWAWTHNGVKVLPTRIPDVQGHPISPSSPPPTPTLFLCKEHRPGTQEPLALLLNHLGSPKNPPPVLDLSFF